MPVVVIRVNNSVFTDTMFSRKKCLQNLLPHPPPFKQSSFEGSAVQDYIKLSFLPFCD